MEFTVSRGPSNDVVLTRYDAVLFPKFRIIFDGTLSGKLAELLALPAGEAERAVVMENRADKDITALGYYWVITDEDGTVKKHPVSTDSYGLNVYHPVLRAGDRKLICREATVDESLLDHVAGGGGVMGISVRGSRDSLAGVVSLRLEIDMLVFADGEIAGPDTNRFAAELLCRKPAAEFVARQIRLAQADGRDVTHVLSALAEIPCLRGKDQRPSDPLVQWIQRYAGQYLRRPVDMRNATLWDLENRPPLPKFYPSADEAN